MVLKTEKQNIKLCCISDTHGFYEKVKIPSCDILIHAGDFVRQGTEHEIIQFVNWLSQQKAKNIICIAGNHDLILEKDRQFGRDVFSGIADYLLDSSVTIKGIKFYGSPYTPRFNNWAWNIDRGSLDLKKKWDYIPEDTDVLITHGPPKYICDKANDGYNCGCEHLRTRIEKIKPKLHIFGHIHEARSLDYRTIPGTWFANVSICTANYRPTNKPVVVDILENGDLEIVNS